MPSRDLGEEDLLVLEAPGEQPDSLLEGSLVRIERVGWDKFADVDLLRRELSLYERSLSPTCARSYGAAAAFRSMTDLADRMTDRDVLTWVAYDSEAPVGYLQIAVGAFCGGGSGLTVKDCGWWVRPAYRPKVGRLLARAAAREIRRSRVEAIQAMVQQENEPMHGLMREHGWKPVAVIYEREISHEQ